MARYVIDAPTLVRVLDSEHPLDRQHQLIAPSSLRSQALQLLLVEVRAGLRSEPAALDLHRRITELKVRLLGDRVCRGLAWSLAREHDWDTLGDAEYLAVTRLQADALVTVDAALAAKARGIVPLAEVAVLLADP